MTNDSGIDNRMTNESGIDDRMIDDSGIDNNESQPQPNLILVAMHIPIFVVELLLIVAIVRSFFH